MRIRLLIYIMFLGLLSLNAQKKTTNQRTQQRTAVRKTTQKTASKATQKTTQKSKGKTTQQQKGKQPAVTNSAIKGLRQEQAQIKQNIKKQEQALRANKAAVSKKLKDLERISSDISTFS